MQAKIAYTYDINLKVKYFNKEISRKNERVLTPGLMRCLSSISKLNIRSQRAMNRAILQDISKLRVNEAKVLIDGGLFSGAYYLLGYSVECGLKACIAKQIKRYDFPDKKIINESYTHDLEKLLNLSGWKKDLYDEFKRNPALELNWTIVKDWNENSRYEITTSERDARDMYSAVTQRKSGVLTWLKKRW